MAKITSKELSLKADELAKQIEASRERYADLILDGKPDRGLMAELATLETELKSTVAAIEIAKRREKEEAERLYFEAQEKAKKEVEKMHGQASNQLEVVIDDIVSAVSSAVVFLQTLQKGKDILYKAGLNGKVMNESEYYEIIANIEGMASGLASVHPKRAYPGHPDLKGELSPLVDRLRGRA